MAVTYSISTKTVRINSDTQRILAILQQLLDRHFPYRTVEDVEELKPGREHERAGVVGYFLRRLEDVTGDAEGGVEKDLPSITAKLDEYPERLYNAYRNSLLQLAKSMHISSAMLITSPIASPYVLTIELLRRIVILMLCRDEKKEVDSQTLLDLYNNFIYELNSQAIFVDIGFFDQHLFNRGQIAVSLGSRTHHIWQQLFSDCVEAQCKLYLNRDAVAHVSDILKACEIGLTQRIVAELDPHITHGENMHPDLVYFKQMQLERKFIQKLDDGAVTRLATLPTTPHEWLSHLESNTALVQQAYRRNNPRGSLPFTSKEILSEGTTHLAKAYELKITCNLLLSVAHKLDQLNQICGWLPYVSGAISLEGYTERVLHHVRECSEFLVLSGNQWLSEEAAGTAIRTYKPTELSSVYKFQFYVSQLNELTRPEIIRFIIETGRGVVSSLDALGQSLGCQLLSTELLHLVQTPEPLTSGRPARAPLATEQAISTSTSGGALAELNESPDQLHEQLVEKFQPVFKFELGQSQVDEEQFAQITKLLPHLKQLVILDVSKNRLGARGITRLLEQLPRCQALKCLHLNEVNLTADHIAELEPVLAHFDHIYQLDLGHNQLTQNALLKLIDLIQRSRCQINELNIAGNLITDAVLDALIKLFTDKPCMDKVERELYDIDQVSQQDLKHYYQITDGKRAQLNELMKQRKPQYTERMKAWMLEYDEIGRRSEQTQRALDQESSNTEAILQHLRDTQVQSRSPVASQGGGRDVRLTDGRPLDASSQSMFDKFMGFFPSASRRPSRAAEEVGSQSSDKSLGELAAKV